MRLSSDRSGAVRARERRHGSFLCLGGGVVVDLGAKLPDKIKFHFAEGVSGQSSSQVASGQSDYLVNQFSP